MKSNLCKSIFIMWFLVFSSPSANSAENITVLLDWFVNPDHAPLFVALEKGFFDERGLNVNFIAPADPNDPPKLVAAGKADIAISYQPQLYLQVGQGLQLVRIGTLIATPLNSLVVLQNGPIKSIKDFYSQDELLNNSEYLLNHFQNLLS